MSGAVDVSRNIVKGGFFVLGKRESTPFNAGRMPPGDEETLVTYRDSGAPIRDALVSAIRSAKRRVFIASFMLGDEDVVKEMIAAASRLKGGVYLITALDDRSLGRGLREYDESEQESPEERKKNFERLTAVGVYVRGHESCHAKFAVIDDRVAIIGSANFVKQAFVWTGEANVRVTRAATVQQLARFFEHLWFEGCTWEVPPGMAYLVAKRHPTAAPHPLPAPTDDPGGVVWTNGSDERSLLQGIRRVIQSASTDLVLSTYSVVQMQAKRELLLDDIFKAARRGVRVRLFVRQRNAYQDQMDDVVAMNDEGVLIHGDTRNHAKVAIADNAEAILFSANFDGHHGLDNGVEVGYRLQERAAVDELVRYLEHAIANSDTRFCRDPSAEQLDGKLAARWCKAWEHEKALSVHASPEELLLLEREGASGPCLFEVSADREYRFHLGMAVAEGYSDGQDWHLRVQLRPGEGTAERKLRDWMKSSRSPGDGLSLRRGIFAGMFRPASSSS
jgi:phosphatidylserine/phosphatidylglycerophosphate/cardiolipin synthase-like enzyme